MKFGENLKKIRKLKKISQEQLAEKLGVSRQSISKWETGENFPSMNNIVCLCDIFKCKINDLVHEDFIDIDSLDEEIKMSVVKFKKDKQKKVKSISKVIYIFSNITKICCRVICFILGIMMILVPFTINKISLNGNSILLDNNVIGELSGNEIEIFTEYFNSHSNIQLVINTEIVFLGLIISIIILMLIFKYLYKLFYNIHHEDTPFTMENVYFIKKIAYYIIAYIAIPYILGFIMQFIMNINLEIELEITDILFAIIVFSISYIFEYGYQIQLDSKGKMYGNENE